MKIYKKKTARGFRLRQFRDRYDFPCSIQKSSLATDDAIWFGIDDAKPKVMAREAASVGVQTTERAGWVLYPIPDNVQLTTRMHLTRKQVKKLPPILQHFADTGEVP
jgi:hypothetical protein